MLDGLIKDSAQLALEIFCGTNRVAFVLSIALFSPDYGFGDAASIDPRRWYDDNNGRNSASVFLYGVRKSCCEDSWKEVSRQIRPGIGSGW